jgi:hypothetical protein
MKTDRSLHDCTVSHPTRQYSPSNVQFINHSFSIFHFKPVDVYMEPDLKDHLVEIKKYLLTSYFVALPTRCFCECDHFSLIKTNV